MDIDKITDQILEITNKSNYAWIESDSDDAERIRVLLMKSSITGFLETEEQFLELSEYMQFRRERNHNKTKK